MDIDKTFNALEKEAKDLTNEEWRYAMMTLFQQVKTRSPVDTGRFRSNWMLSEYTPDLSTTDATDRDMPEVPQKVLDKTYYLSNNLSYAQRLEEGWSDQAPSGIVALSVAATESRMKGRK